MSNEQNLRVPTSEEARINGKKGGIASGEARRRNKTMRELGLALISNKIVNEELKKRIKEYFPDTNDEDLQVQTAMLVGQINKAIKGDSKAFELVRDTVGQKPVDKQEISNVDKDGFLRVVIDGVDISEDDDK